MIRKRKIEEKAVSFALREEEAIGKAIDCQQGEAKPSYRGNHGKKDLQFRLALARADYCDNSDERYYG